MEEDSFVAENIRCHFLQILGCRRSAQVPFCVENGKPVVNPLFQDNTLPTDTSEAMESFARKEIKNFKDLLNEENLYLTIEVFGKRARLFACVNLSLKDSKERRPAIVFLNSTNKCKEWLRPLLEAYASRRYVAVAIDSRYHGERAANKTTYRDVWDLIKLADYLTQREDIDPARIGITGESLGGWSI